MKEDKHDEQQQGVYISHSVPNPRSIPDRIIAKIKFEVEMWAILLGVWFGMSASWAELAERTKWSLQGPMGAREADNFGFDLPTSVVWSSPWKPG